jgi:UDP-glucose 4-epimerase
MTWLVTGGAGYIGAHVVRAFAKVGLDCVVLDDLSSGHRGFVPDDVPLVQGSITDTDLVADTLARRGIEGVVHLAAFKYAGVSVQRPLHTYTQNVTGTVSLLDAMASQGVDKIVYSSSAAVFGTPDTDLVTEQTPTTPQSPYGESKLVGEWLLRDQATAVGLRHTSLRYFNVVGSGTPDIWDTSPHNLFPLVFDALLDDRTPIIKGADYPTPDGTCVRDYIHVDDLADAHIAAIDYLANGGATTALNVGTGIGTSVKQVLDAIERVAGRPVPHDVVPRRAGDPVATYADPTRSREVLDWSARYGLDEIIESAYRWHLAQLSNV